MCSLILCALKSLEGIGQYTCQVTEPGMWINPLPTNDTCVMNSYKNLYGGFNTLYRLFGFKLFPVVGKGLINAPSSD